MHGHVIQFKCESGYRFEFNIDISLHNATCNNATRKFEPQPDKCVRKYIRFYFHLQSNMFSYVTQNVMAISTEYYVLNGNLFK